MLAVNLTGSFLCAQAALPDMLEAGWGRIVNIASTAGQKGYAYVSAYTAAKHGVIGLTRSLALEVARKGVTVNAVCPGYTDTDILRDSVANVVEQDRPQRRRSAGRVRGRQSAAAHRAAGRGGRCGALAVRRGRGFDHRPVDLGLGRGSDMKQNDASHAAAQRRRRSWATRRAPARGDHAVLKLWLRMLASTTQIEAEIRKRLRERFGISLARFDYMAQLYRYRDGLKMRVLSRYLMVTGGNVTGLTDELEREGVVQRSASPEDRRAWIVSLTPKGRRSFEAMAKEHEEWLLELFAGLDEKAVAAAVLRTWAPCACTWCDRLHQPFPSSASLSLKSAGAGPSQMRISALKKACFLDRIALRHALDAITVPVPGTQSMVKVSPAFSCFWSENIWLMRSRPGMSCEYLVLGRVVFHAAGEELAQFVGIDVAQHGDRHALGAGRGQHLLGAAALLAQVEAGGVDLEHGLVAHACAIELQLAAIEFERVVELDAGHVDRRGRGRRARRGQGWPARSRAAGQASHRVLSPMNIE